MQGLKQELAYDAGLIYNDLQNKLLKQAASVVTKLVKTLWFAMIHTTTTMSKLMFLLGLLLCLSLIIMKGVERRREIKNETLMSCLWSI